MAVAGDLIRPHIPISLFILPCFLVIALDIPRVDINFLFIGAFKAVRFFCCNLKGLWNYSSLKQKTVQPSSVGIYQVARRNFTVFVMNPAGGK
jgi:hypothetical protein